MARDVAFGAAERARIRRFLSSGGRDEERAAKRHAIETELERIRNLYRWGDMAEREYVDESRRLRSSLDALGTDVVPAQPREDAMRLASRIGEAWATVSIEMRRRFVTEWFAELRLNRDGAVDVVPRENVREIVYPATERSAPWAVLDSNQRPLRCERSALTS